MNHLSKVKSALITALIVMVAMQLLTAIIGPYIPIIAGGLVVVGVGGYLYQRSKKL